MAFYRGYEVRPIAVRAERDEISSEAGRTFHAMANTRHEKFQITNESRPIVMSRLSSKVVGINTHLTGFKHSHYDPPK